ncbi:MAG: Uma2 family endonuclease [Gemmataceae bacterium]|nr:Uma2 family endonuclease [Gemmataceae bacterium]MCI0742915.1 Uma2 family endonuclease [Gemmataceae bacterium]
MATGTITATATNEQKIWDPDTLYEIVNGERVEVPSMGVFACLLANSLRDFLNEFCIPRKLGIAVLEVLFRLKTAGPSRRPDVAFLRKELIPKNLFDDPPEIHGYPDLAVEVVSPSNTFAELEEKVLEYFEAGVRLVWIIVPRSRRIYVYSSPTNVLILQEQDELSGDPVLPGFRLKVADLFSEPLQRTGDN